MKTMLVEISFIIVVMFFFTFEKAFEKVKIIEVPSTI